MPWCPGLQPEMLPVLFPLTRSVQCEIWNHKHVEVTSSEDLPLLESEPGPELLSLV